MKKRLLSLLTIVALLLTMVSPVVAATPELGYAVDLIGVTEAEEEAALQVDLKMSMRLTAVTCAALQTVTLIYNTEKLSFASLQSGSEIAVTTAGLTSVANTGPNANRYTNDASASEVKMYSATKGSNEVILRVEVNLGTDSWGDYCKDGLNLMSFGFNFVGDTTVDDLDSGDLRIATAEEASSYNSLDVAKVTDENNNIYGYGTSKNESDVMVATPEADKLIKPTITIDGKSLAMNLGSVEIEMDYTAVNAPVLLPTAEAARTVAVKSVKALDTAGNEFDVTEAAKVAYAYSLKKAGTGEGVTPVELTDAEKAYFSIDATTGTVTVQPGAPIIDLVVVATGSYTNSRGNESTADGECALAIHHGDAGSVVPGGDPTGDGELVFSGVAITNADGDTLVTSAADSRYTETIGIPTSGSDSVTFVGMAVDQFGGEFADVTGSWDDTVTTGTGTSVANGVVTVATGADGADFDYQFSASNDGTDYTATVEVVVSNTVINWPALTNDTIVYGQPISDLTFDADGCTVTDHDIDVTASASFAWDVENMAATLNAGTTKLTMKCDYEDSTGVAQTATKAYPVAVNKADQVISIAQDGTAATTLVNIEIGLATDLAPIVKNATVAEAEGVSAISYSAIGGNTALVSRSDNEITGLVLSADADDLATLTLTAAGNDNYNEASREISLYVSNQLLRADRF